MNPDQAPARQIVAEIEPLRPVLGLAGCGLFGITEDYEEAYLSLDQYLVKNREATYFVRAMGNSMQPFILPGDILVVDRSVRAQHGHIVTATLRGERLCKRLSKKAHLVQLLSENKDYRPITIESDMELVIFGVVSGIVRALGRPP